MVVITRTVDLDALARVYRKVYAADLHLPDHSDPSVEDRLRWTAEAPGFTAAQPERRASMAVAETNTRVWGALQAIRFRHVGDLVPFDGWRSHRMLVRDLR